MVGTNWHFVKTFFIFAVLIQAQSGKQVFCEEVTSDDCGGDHEWDRNDGWKDRDKAVTEFRDLIKRMSTDRDVKVRMGPDERYSEENDDEDDEGDEGDEIENADDGDDDGDDGNDAEEDGNNHLKCPRLM